MKIILRTIYTLMGLDDAFWQGASNPRYFLLSSLITLLGFIVLWVLRELDIWAFLIFLIINLMTIYAARLFMPAKDQSLWWPRAITGFRAWLYDDFYHPQTPSPLLISLVFLALIPAIFLIILSVLFSQPFSYFIGLIGLSSAKLLLLNRFARTQIEDHSSDDDELSSHDEGLPSHDDELAS